MAGKKSRDTRLVAVALLLVICLAVVAGKLVIIQGIDASRYKELASEQRERFIKTSPHRGTIFDREGEIMAISEEVTTIYATPYHVEEPEATAREIAEIIGEDPRDVQEKLESDSGFVYIARKIDVDVADEVRKQGLEGIGFIEESRRFYPMGDVAAQVLGLVDVDNRGQAGLELYYEDILGGKPGEILLERDAVGNPIPASEKRKVQAVDGTDIQLTIDKEIQTRAEESLSAAVERYGAKAGTAIVLDCNCGDVLAMANCPGFDPNDRGTIEQENTRNRAVTDVYEPGSVLKILTAAAALEEGVVNPDTVISAPGKLQLYDKEFKEATPTGPRDLSFTQVITQSSNVGTIKVALELGAKRLASYFDRFGLGHRTGIDFPGEVGGIVPSLSEWSGTSVAAMSIGQGISITPLQMACVAGTVANGGRRICPHFLKATISEKGVTDMGLGGLGDEMLSDETCEELKLILQQVVAPDGTGSRAAVKYYAVAGKTGTAAKPLRNAAGYSNTYMATFVGFAPVERPRLVVLVVLDEPCPIWGGYTSAPVFAEIMGFSLQRVKAPPGWAP